MHTLGYTRLPYAHELFALHFNEVGEHLLTKEHGSQIESDALVYDVKVLPHVPRVRRRRIREVEDQYDMERLKPGALRPEMLGVRIRGVGVVVCR